MVTGDRPAPRVLVVDDDELIRSVLHTALVQSGFSVRDAENAQAALHLLDIHGVDLIVLDAHMGDETLDGNLAALRLKAASAAIVVLSGARVAPELLTEFGATYLAKPVDFAEFVSHVTKALER